MNNCGKCHSVVDVLKKEGAVFREYDLTRGKRTERIEGKKKLFQYSKELELKKNEQGLVDMPVVVCLEKERVVNVFQGIEAIKGIEKCISTP